MRVGADENCGLLSLTFARISRPMPVYGPFEKNCNIFSIFHSGKGQTPFAGTARRVLRTKGVCPLSFPCVTSIVLQFFCDEPYLLEARRTCSGERTTNRRFGKAWIGVALAVFLPAGLRRGGRRQMSP